jgi:hypothetical protein
MKASLTGILLITLVVSVNANPFSAYFNNIIDTVLGRKTEKAKDELVLAREHALKSWHEAGLAIEDLSSATWDKLYDGYETAWAGYQTAKHKIAEKLKKGIAEASKDYEIAKEEVKTNAKKVADFFVEYKDKIEEKTSDVYFTTLEKLEDAAKTARSKFGTARDKIAAFYDDAHDEAIDDYNAAAKSLHEATERAKKYAEKKTEKNYEATMKKLDAAKNKAKEYYKTSKGNLEESKNKVEKFNDEIKEYVNSYAETAKARAAEALASLNSYKNDAKSKADKRYQTVLYNLQKANDRAIAGAQEAEINAEYLEKRIKRKIANVIDDVKTKYESLKDEL